jgi:hypothetical protein
MAPKQREGGGTGAKGSAKDAAAPALPAPRNPTLKQRLVVAIYVYFIPVFLLLNVAMLFSRYTAVPWLV